MMLHIYFYKDQPMWEQIVSMCDAFSMYDAFKDRGLCVSVIRDSDGKIILQIDKED